jgi:high-affinity iron transporter
MLAAFLIMIREGLEASLIVVIIAAYLNKTGRRDLLKPMWIGVGLAAALCIAAGVGLQWANQELPQAKQELLEATVGFAAVIVLTWMIFWMRRAGKAIKGELEAKIDSAVTTPGAAAKALIAMAFFAVVREGLESALFLLAAFQQGGAAAGIGAVLGLAVAIGLGVGLYLGSVQLDVRKFFTWTGGVIIFFAAGLLAQAVGSLHEAGIYDGLQTEAWDWSGTVSNTSTVGSILRGLFGYQATPTVGQVIVYWAYLIPVAFLFFGVPFIQRRRAARAALAEPSPANPIATSGPAVAAGASPR